MSKPVSSTFLAMALSAILPPATQAQNAAQGAVQMGDKEIAKVLSTCKKPVWPAESLSRQETGSVVISFLTGADGKVKESEVIRSSGFPRLDDAAVVGLRACTFEAALRAGLPIESWKKMEYVWTLSIDGQGDSEANVLASAIQGLERHDPEAQYIMATVHLSGKGAKRDVTEGMRLLEASAKQGYARAQERLGVIYISGGDVPVDAEKAAHWFRQAARMDMFNSQAMLGVLLSQGQGVPKDEAEAMMWFRKSAKQGNTLAQVSLGRMLLAAAGDTGDASEAASWFDKAADRGDRTAQTSLGMLYELGRGVPRDASKAAELYRRAAQTGSVHAKLALAGLYERGDGVPLDKEKAKALREQAAGR